MTLGLDVPDWVRDATVEVFRAAVDRGRIERAGRLRVPDGVSVGPETRYCGDDPHQALAVYRPANAGGHFRPPLIVDIHGGGWVYGDLGINHLYCSRLAELGFMVANVAYRLQPGANLRDQVQDLFAALHWLGAHADECGFDPGNVFLTGDSAGGHLAALISCVDSSGREQRIFGVAPDHGLSIRAVGIVNGVVEGTYRTSPGSPLLDVADRALIKSMCGGDPEAPWRPYRSFAVFMKDVELKPMFVVSGLSDPFYTQTRHLLGYLASRRARVEPLIWPKDRRLGHVFNIMEVDWEESRRTNAAMCDYFRRWLR